MFKRLAREPLVHFLLLGLLLFLLYELVGGSGGDRTIRVDDKVVAALTAQFTRTWQRPPTPDELRGMVDSYVRDEIFYREGMAVGLDRDDPLIKRQVRQKFEILAEESEAFKPPTDELLLDWMKAHPERYAEPSVVTFDQVLIDPVGHGRGTEGMVKSVRARLAAGADPATVGDGRMLPPRIVYMPLDLVARDFGGDFAKDLGAAKVGGWEGPIKSGYGLHLVRVERRIPGRMPELSQVKAVVARDWEADRRSKAVDAYYRRLRSEYQVELAASAK
jgi:hypothetical protein